MKYKKGAAIGAGLFAIFIALVIVDELAVKPEPSVVNSETKPTVSTLTLMAKPHYPTVALIGNTRARFVTQLKVTSDGQLAWLDQQLEPGTLIEQNTPLAKLDVTHLHSELAQANSRVVHAELELERQLHEQSVALSMLSTKNQSRFAKREPQVAAAKSDLAQAKQALKSSQKRLQEANIIAPFDAVILSRLVSPNDLLTAGQALFEVAASDSMDVVVPVSEPLWQKFHPQLLSQQIRINVTDRAGNTWPAALRYVAPNVDLTTRQRQLVLNVVNPYAHVSPLLPNQPVQVSVSFSEPLMSYQVPQSAVTRDGYVWTLSENNTLQKEAVEVLSHNEEHVHIRFNTETLNTKQVVVYPLLSMIAGTQVSAINSHTQFAGNQDTQGGADELAY
ncbi:hypothetical protein N473_04765 [Pseudoalteromonas luteoviolacea CPMOR-1]|uniref:Uncharacterized protein n=1 Tax=Pseudoalteromonas luteoviolacea CPMOR-1 TaxID=1365248 RepID=A0A167I0I5_9GAMM|nr:efflux RND transporter periplasmic adaptor subunit [Pseudoalteromonas luteoviolacea]KZN58750.1 hypothetical protein N473_04765 [Pseudoalteromonas luteoviolacea CPMOR-1]